MNLFVVEDELPARERLIETIARVEPQAHIVGVAGSLAEARAWLARNARPDLMLLDVQLADGLSFELFSEGAVACPAVFATAYDEFVLDAFKANAIDYVLKPVADAALAAAFASYRRLRAHFAADDSRAAIAGIAGAAVAMTAPRLPRQRLLARQGNGFVSLRVDEIGYFVSLDKATYAVDLEGRRRLVDPTLAELAEQLDPQRFFRISRQMIVAAQAVLDFRALGKGRLAVRLVPDGGESVVVSQERASAFRDWLAS